MDKINSYDVLIAYVYFDKNPGGKKRPVLYLGSTSDKIQAFRITSKFENKSKHIQKQYCEIIDWQQAGLTKKSWIDVANVVGLPADLNIKKVGKLSDRDINGLKTFIENATDRQTKLAKEYWNYIKSQELDR